MPTKRTFTRRTMAFAPSDDSASVSKAHTNKRRKPSPPETSSPLPRPHSSAVASDNDILSQKPKQANRQSRAAKKGHSSKLGGPISIPDDHMAREKASNTKDVFEAGLQNINRNAQKAQQCPGSSTQSPRNYADSPTCEQNTSSDDCLEIVDIFKHDKGRNNEATTRDDKNFATMESSLCSGETSAIDASTRIFDGREYTSSPTPPPQKTLSKDRLSKRSRQAELWTKNQTESPLLRLPAEIRQLIYKYALGGNTVVLEYLNYIKLKSNDGGSHCIPVFRYGSTVYDQPCNPFAVGNCKENLPYEYGMSLLNGVCRQLYNETYTLSYSMNHLCFESAHQLFNFIVMENHLSHCQREGITQITVKYDLPAPSVLMKLPQLTRVRLMCPPSWKDGGWWDVDRTGDELVLRKHVTL